MQTKERKEKYAIISLEMSKELLAKIDAKARKMECSRSYYIRKSLIDSLEEE